MHAQHDVNLQTHFAHARRTFFDWHSQLSCIKIMCRMNLSYARPKRHCHFVYSVKSVLHHRVFTHFGRVKRKSVFLQYEKAQVQIILRMRKLSSGPSFSIHISSLIIFIAKFIMQGVGPQVLTKLVTALIQMYML